LIRPLLVVLLLATLMPRVALGAPAQSLAVLIVSDGRSAAQKAKEEQMIHLIHKSLDDQGLPREVLPILTYHTNKADERIYLERTLGIKTKDLVFLGLAQHQNLVVKKVILREPNVGNPEDAVASLFQRAVAVLTGVNPDVTPSPDQTPIYTPHTTSSSTRIMSAVLCRAVNAAGEPLERTSDFSPRDAFYVSCDVRGLRQGTVLEAKWYSGSTLIKSGRLVSDKVGDYYAWFAMQPLTTWLPGTYKVSLFVNGQQQASEYFRVNDRE
jgi:hypothetical protein